MKYRAYPAYKDSGVEWLGEVPEDWRIQRLRFAITLNPNKSEVSKLPGDRLVSFLPMESISENGILDLSQRRDLESVYQGFTYFKNGDVVIAKITPCFENGKGALAKHLEGGIGFGTTELHVLRPIDGCSAEFLWWVTKSDHFRLLGEQSMKGAAGQKRVPEDFIKDWTQTFPPFKEQTQIATFLDRETQKIDTLIEKQERLIELLQEKRQAVISHAVTKGLDPNVKMKDSGVEWLGEVPEHWYITKIGYLSSKIGSGKTPFGGNEIYKDHGVLFLRSQNVYDEGLRLTDLVYIPNEIDEEMKYSRTRHGDILINITGASLGRTCLIPEMFPPANVNQHVCIIRLKNNTFIQFVSFYLKSKMGKAIIDISQTGAAREGLNFQQIANLPIVLPTQVNEISKITEFLNLENKKIDVLISKANQAITLLKEHRTALISAAVTGKIDVRPVASLDTADQPLPEPAAVTGS